MGTSVQLVVYSDDEAIANQAAKAAFGRIQELSQVLSDYDPESELNRACRRAVPGMPVRISEELFDVIELSLSISHLTDGAFDVTVGPLTRLWRQVRREGRLPSASEVDRARELVGYRSLQLDPVDRTMEFLVPGMSLDLGGIAKGFIADQALQTLEQLGVGRVLLDVGGDVRVGEPPPGAEGWRIGVAPLDELDTRPVQMLLLKDAAVATSGDGVRFIEVEGRRHSHILSPATGQSLTLRSSITVVAPTGAQADAVATALSVLDPSVGLDVIHSQAGVAALIVKREDDRTTVQESSGWAACLDR